MQISGVADVRRLVGLMAMASALALVLLGGLAVPAAAQTRKQAVTQANAVIAKCFKEGGEVDASVESDGSIGVGCYKSADDHYVCTWQPSTGYKQNCSLTATGAGTHAPIGGGVLDGAGVAQDLGVAPRHLDIPKPHGQHKHHRDQRHKK